MHWPTGRAFSAGNDVLLKDLKRRKQVLLKLNSVRFVWTMKIGAPLVRVQRGESLFVQQFML